MSDPRRYYSSSSHSPYNDPSLYGNTGPTNPSSPYYSGPSNTGQAYQHGHGAPAHGYAPTTVPHYPTTPYYPGSGAQYPNANAQYPAQSMPSFGASNDMYMPPNVSSSYPSYPSNPHPAYAATSSSPPYPGQQYAPHTVPPPDPGTTIKQCYNCGALSTPLWRRHPATNRTLCNACGLYQHQRNEPRPQALIDAENDDGSSEQPFIGDPNGPQCSHCLTRETSVWRRNKNGDQVCNACGVYERLRGKERPLSLVKNKIKSRAKHTPI